MCNGWLGRLHNRPIRVRQGDEISRSVFHWKAATSKHGGHADDLCIRVKYQRRCLRFGYDKITEITWGRHRPTSVDTGNAKLVQRKRKYFWHTGNAIPTRKQDAHYFSAFQMFSNINKTIITTLLHNNFILIYYCSYGNNERVIVRSFTSVGRRPMTSVYSCYYIRSY